jgi:hypothetical protein
MGNCLALSFGALRQACRPANSAPCGNTGLACREFHARIWPNASCPLVCFRGASGHALDGGVLPSLCRFLGRRDVGPSPRAHGRRRRSAKARSRGNWGRRVQRALWRFDRSAGVDCGLAIATDVHANTISARWTVGERLCEPPLGGFATPIGCFRPSRIVAGAGPADRRGQVASG